MVSGENENQKNQRECLNLKTYKTSHIEEGMVVVMVSGKKT